MSGMVITKQLLILSQPWILKTNILHVSIKISLNKFQAIEVDHARASNKLWSKVPGIQFLMKLHGTTHFLLVDLLMGYKNETINLSLLKINSVLKLF